MGQTTNEIIQLLRVSKTFNRSNKAFTALKGANLAIRPGEMVGIIGKSGSGKTTLLNMITGIDSPTSGSIRVDGTEISGLTESQKAVFRGRNIGIVFQFFQLMPTLTVLENILLAMEFANTIPMNERYRRALDLLGEMGVSEQAGKLPASLSGGEQQRVAIARAMANDPAIIAADEPTGNLDTATSGRIIEIFNRLVRGGKTILVVTHQPDLGFAFTRGIRISDGVLEEDTVSVVRGIEKEVVLDD